MADPLSISASAAGLLSLGISACNGLVQFYAAWKSYGDDIALLFSHIANLSQTLSVLNKVIQDEAAIRDVSSTETIEGCIKPCETHLQKLDSILHKINAQSLSAQGFRERLKTVGRRAIYPFRESTIAKLKDNILDAQDQLQLALQAIQFKTSVQQLGTEKKIEKALSSLTVNQATTANAVSTLSQKISIHHLQGTQHLIHQWLAPPDPSSNHAAACKKKDELTGSWFLNSQELAQWKRNPGSRLWLHAIPGAGKTILCSTIIESLFNDPDYNRKLIYYYFDFSDSAKQRSEDLLRSILSQTALLDSKSSEELVTLHGRCQDGRTKPTFDELLSTVHHSLGHLQNCCIVIDALDEAQDWDQVASVIESLLKSETNIKVLFTSRREPQIVETLKPLQFTQVSFQHADVDADIRIHVQKRLKSNPRLRRWPQPVQQEIEDAVMKSAAGMFRLASCQLDELQKAIQLSGLRKCLRQLPKTLEETYLRILSQIDETHHAHALMILRWLCFSSRPMKLDEMVEILAVDCQSSVFDPAERIPRAEDILTICPSLLTVVRATVPNAYDFQGQETDELHLAHYSIKEFLISKKLAEENSAFSVQSNLAHATIAHVCLIYVHEFEGTPFSTRTDLSRFPLAAYAATEWVKHLKSSGQDYDDSEVTRLAQSLLEDEQKRVTWLRVYNPDQPGQKLGIRHRACPLANRQTPMYCAVIGGLDHLARNLIKKGYSPNARGTKYGNALQAAAKVGSLNIAQELVRNGSDVNERGGYYGSALQAAAASNHLEIVQWLLADGAQINARGGRLGTALAAAAGHNHFQIFEYLLDTGADPRIRGGYYGSALQAASFAGNVSMVEKLLGVSCVSSRAEDIGVVSPTAEDSETDDDKDATAHGDALPSVSVTIDDFQGCYYTALQAAARSGCKQIVEMLVRHGADVNAMGGEYGSALGAAAQTGDLAIAKFLIEAGANVNLSVDKSTPFLSAVRSGNLELVKLLVNNGVDVQLGVQHSGSPLAVAASRNRFEIYRYLIDAGADINATTPDEKKSVFLEAAAGGNLNSMQDLIDRGIAVNAHNVNGRAALSAALRGNAMSPRMMLSLCSVTGLIPVSAIIENPNAASALKVCRRLLKYGANPNGEFKTSRPLNIAANFGFTDIVHELLAAGADPNLTDTGYKGALHAAANGGHIQLVQELLPNVKKFGHGIANLANALSCAAKRGDMAMLKLLLDAGALAAEDSVRRHYQAKPTSGGQFTPALIAAAEQGQDECVKVLLAEGCDPAMVKSTSYQRSTALEAAAERGNANIVEMLCTAQPALLQSEDARVALCSACSSGHWKVAKYFLEAGVDVRCTKDSQDSIMAKAASSGSLALIRLLLSHGVDPLSSKTYGPSAIGEAAALGDLEMVNVLLDAVGRRVTLRSIDVVKAAGDAPISALKLLIERCNIEAERGSEYDRSLLDEAVRYGRCKTVQFLLNYDKCDTREKSRTQAFITAATRGRLKIAKLLYDTGIDINAFSNKWEGGTALHRAAAEHHDRMIYFLLQNGASINSPDKKGMSALDLALSRDSYPPARTARSREVLRQHGGVSLQPKPPEKHDYWPEKTTEPEIMFDVNMENWNPLTKQMEPPIRSTTAKMQSKLEIERDGYFWTTDGEKEAKRSPKSTSERDNLTVVTGTGFKDEDEKKAAAEDEWDFSAWGTGLKSKKKKKSKKPATAWDNTLWGTNVKDTGEKKSEPGIEWGDDIWAFGVKSKTKTRSKQPASECDATFRGSEIKSESTTNGQKKSPTT